MLFDTLWKVPIVAVYPLRVAFGEYEAIGRDLRSARSVRAWLGSLFGQPGWQPSGAAAAAEPVPAVTGARRD